MFDVTALKIPEGYYLRLHVWPEREEADTIHFILIQGVSPVAAEAVSRLELLRNGGQPIVDRLVQQANERGAVVVVPAVLVLD